MSFLGNLGCWMDGGHEFRLFKRWLVCLKCGKRVEVGE